MLITPSDRPWPISENGYLLIEPSNLHADLDGILAKTLACAPPFLWNADSFLPRLLRIDMLDHRERKHIFQLIEQEESEEYPPIVCAWLQSNRSIEQLANSIARFVRGRAPDGTDVIWRSYDPRVFILTAHLFNEKQGHVLLGVAECWTFPWRGKWWCVHGAQNFGSSPDDLDVGWPHPSQWALLSKSKLFHQMHIRLREEILSPAQCLDQLAHTVTTFMETDHYSHEDNDEDRAEFTYLSTRYRNIFRTSHELLTVWAMLRERKITLRQMLDSISREDIEVINKRINKNGAKYGEFSV